jgi:iron complex outermembrane recepter protein
MKKRLIAKRKTHLARITGPGNWRHAPVRCITAGLVLAGGGTVQAQQANPTNETLAGVLQEVIVTAQRRSQSTQDIPYNITAVNADQIARSGSTGVNDLAALVPGLTTVDTGAATRGGTNNLTLRGLRTDNPGGSGTGSDQAGATVSSVSTYFGETPVFFPIALKDLDHVEVLRGPQGTLYGQGAQAGTIRFIPKRPDFNRFSGEVNASGSITTHAPNSNGEIDAVLNAPINDRLAVRLVAGYDKQAGFIDQTGLVARTGPGLLAPAQSANPADPFSAPAIAPISRGTNSSTQWFARAALRWKPTDDLDLEVSYLHQKTHTDDTQTSNPEWRGGPVSVLDGAFPAPPYYANSVYQSRPGGRYTNNAWLLQPYDNKVDLVSGVATMDLGLATITSATSYYNNESTAVNDSTSLFVNTGSFNFWPYYGNFPRGIAVTNTFNMEKSFVQEVRIVSKWDKPFNYVAGVYFQRQSRNAGYNGFAPGIDDFAASQGVPFAGPSDPLDQTFNLSRDSVFRDRAVFGELTYNLTSKWQITGGARFFRQSFHLDAASSFVFIGGGTTAVSNDSKVNDHVFKLNTSYDILPNLKVYATYSEGFRRGGANGVPSDGVFASLPAYLTYTPDIAKNFEVGIKGILFDRRLQFSGDIYQINLSNFQFNATSPSSFPLVYNGSKAQSRGAELELTGRLTPALTVSFGYTYTDAKVKNALAIYDLPVAALFSSPPADPILNISLPAGTRLPGVSRSTVNLGVDYVVPFGSSDANIALHADGSYASAQNGAIDPGSTFFWIIPERYLVNLRVSYDSGKEWGVDLFARNVTNDPGYSGGFNPQFIPNAWANRVVSRPRTVGLALHWKF